MAASPATSDRFTAALAGTGGGTVVRVAALTPSRPAGDLANELRFVAAAASAASANPNLRSAMARAGAILLQFAPESPDAAQVDIPPVSSVSTRQPRRRRSRRYEARRPVAAVG